MQDTHNSMDEHCHMFRKNLLHYHQADLLDDGGLNQDTGKAEEKGSAIADQIASNEDLYKSLQQDFEDQEDMFEEECKASCQIAEEPSIQGNEEDAPNIMEIEEQKCLEDK